MIDDIAVVVEVNTSLEQESAVGAEQWIRVLAHSSHDVAELAGELRV